MGAPLIVQPDLEGWVVEQLAPLAGVTAFTYTAITRELGWIVAHYVQVDARSGRKKAAHDLAEQARQIIAALPDVPWPDGVVCYVQQIEGPFWLSDPEGGPRYVARYEIRVHPQRSAAAPAARAAPPQERNTAQ